MTTVAVAQYPIGMLANFDAWAEECGQWVAEATQHSAQLLVFPEYSALTLCPDLLPEQPGNPRAQVRRFQELLPRYLESHRQWAQTHSVYILAGSCPVAVGTGYVNRAYFIAPSGAVSWQDKQIMTPFENEDWGISPSLGLRVFNTHLGCIAINICYDVEFPLLSRAQAQAGAQWLLVPSCTDTRAGYWRVRIGGQARALENQMTVFHSVTVGNAPWNAALDVNVGTAGIYTPPDYGLPDEGVLALGRRDQPMWLYAAIDSARVKAVRDTGQVRNFADWSRQGPITLPEVEVIDLF